MMKHALMVGALALVVGCKNYEVLDERADAADAVASADTDMTAADGFSIDSSIAVTDAVADGETVPDVRDAADGADLPLGFLPSNNIRWIPGTDAEKKTGLAGNCTIQADNGKITCESLVIRLNTPDVNAGIGWTVVAATAPNCNGTSAAAPSIAVFSFGDLEIATGAVVTVVGTSAVALVAAKNITIHGAVSVRSGAPTSGGPSPASAPPACDTNFAAPGTCGGGGGAGGLTAGGKGGGPTGAPGGAAIAPQINPLCPGSGDGGGALALVAGGGINLLGPATELGCGIAAAGLGSPGGPDPAGAGYYKGKGGLGGGSGGTVIVETPALTMSAPCVIACNGGGGGGGAGTFPSGCTAGSKSSAGANAGFALDAAVGGDGGLGCPSGGRGGSGGAAGSAAGSGTALSSGAGGGGGGSAGFVHLRIRDCATAAAMPISPTPSCSTL